MTALGVALRRLFGRAGAAKIPPAPDLAGIDAALQAGDAGWAETLLDAVPASAWDDAGMQVRRGRLLALKGNHQAAAECFEFAIEIKPDDAQALIALGGIMRARGAAPAAVDLWQRALKAAPGARGLHYNLACALAEAGELAAALDQALLAQQEAPEAEAAGLLLGQLHELAGCTGAAAAAYAALATRNPQLGEAWAGLGRAHRDAAQFSAAQQAFARAGDDWLLDLGLAQFHQRRHEEAIATFGRLLDIDPDRADARVALANTRIAAGDFTAGWPEYAARFRIAGRNWAQPVGKPWRGEALAGQTLLVDAEQGYGDSFFAARFLPLARARANRLVLRCPAPLKAVLAASSLVDAVVADGESVAADAHAYLLSLPQLLGLASPAAAQAYLHAPAEARQRWQGRLEGTGPAIGLVWSGLASAPQNRYRAFDPEPLAKRLAGRARLFALQVPGHDIPPCPAQVTDLSPDLADFAETAAALECLDLVISTETAVAHLAGALGVRTWVPLPLTADWRLEIAGVQNPWYGSVRVFRQTAPMRWDDVFDRINAGLDALEPAPSGA